MSILPHAVTPTPIICPNPHRLHVQNTPIFSHIVNYIGIIAAKYTYLSAEFPQLTEFTSFDARSALFTMLDPSKEKAILCQLINGTIMGQNVAVWNVTLANKLCHLTQGVSTHMQTGKFATFF